MDLRFYRFLLIGLLLALVVIYTAIRKKPTVITPIFRVLFWFVFLFDIIINPASMDQKGIIIWSAVVVVFVAGSLYLIFFAKKMYQVTSISEEESLEVLMQFAKVNKLILHRKETRFLLSNQDADLIEIHHNPFLCVANIKLLDKSNSLIFGYLIQDFKGTNIRFRNWYYLIFSILSIVIAFL